jgi:hypothetical protein
LVVRWFHAVDAPKRKPFPSGAAKPPDKPLPPPKKWIPFSPTDCRMIESAYQKLGEEEDAAETHQNLQGSPSSTENKQMARTTKVPVNEDYLFDVDIEARELAPAYWHGPVYDVKRGTWFTQDGDPCDENLAAQLEEGYLKVKPWRFETPQKRSESQPRVRPVSLNVKTSEEFQNALKRTDSKSNPVTPKASFDDLRSQDQSGVMSGTQADDSPRTHRLFGTYMNSVVTYQDDKTAWLLTDDFMSRMGSTLYSRFLGGGHFAGTKYIRGFIDPKKKDDKVSKEGKDGKDTQVERPGSSGLSTEDDTPAKAANTSPGVVSELEEDEEHQSPLEARRRTLERHMSSLMISAEDSEKEEEIIRKRDEKEMREDYKDQNKDEQGREIEHLLLVTHGIGQRLGMRMESVNFIHDVNTFRKSLKSVYSNSPDLQALNSDVDREYKNSKVQVLPICWRHLLDFPRQGLKHNRREHDLGDLDVEDNEYPNLEDITVEGVPAVRNLVTDLALDILLYQSPVYKTHISRIVVQECNRIYKLFKERNPGFNGKVSFVGHSLGSAIMFDMLCQQKDDKTGTRPHKHRHAKEENLKLDFEVEDFYALGSPIGLFQMLKGRTIVARSSGSSMAAETPTDVLDDPFADERVSGITTSSPRCKQIFNIFHPTDPISYRIEPLISPAMSSLKPQPLPYTKKGIFGAPAAQGLTGIGARVGQGVSEFWTSVSSGIASGILNRSLGITGAEASRLSADLSYQKSSRPLSVGAGTNIGGGVISKPLTPGEAGMAIMSEERMRRLGNEPIAPGKDGERPPTLIDSEIETLFDGFQKRRKSLETEDVNILEKDIAWKDLEDRSRRLKREEAKLRALNVNGRVDYSIQEGAFDISLLASIASHLSYWADEDVSHFMISQLLASHRVFAK